MLWDEKKIKQFMHSSDAKLIHEFEYAIEPLAPEIILESNYRKIDFPIKLKDKYGWILDNNKFVKEELESFSKIRKKFALYNEIIFITLSVTFFTFFSVAIFYGCKSLVYFNSWKGFFKNIFDEIVEVIVIFIITFTTTTCLFQHFSLNVKRNRFFILIIILLSVGYLICSNFYKYNFEKSRSLFSFVLSILNLILFIATENWASKKIEVVKDSPPIINRNIFLLIFWIILIIGIMIFCYSIYILLN